EGDRVRQGPHGRHRHLHVLRVAAVTAGAVDHRSLQAHLRPARAAVLAVTAAVVMVVHHALADPGFLVGDSGAHCRDDAAGLVTRDHAGRPLDATRDDATRIGWGAVVVQVAAAHARGLDLEDHVARAGARMGELSELQLAISEKYDAFHAPPPVRVFGEAQPDASRWIGLRPCATRSADVAELKRTAKTWQPCWPRFSSTPKPFRFP